MNRMYLGMVAMVLIAGCASPRPAVVATSPAGDVAMACAAEVLVDSGYEVREGRGPDLTLEAEVRLNHSPVGATREIITTSLSRSSAPPELSVITSAWMYDSAEHSVPVARQSVTEVRPSDRLVEDARRVLETCGLEAGLGS